jgi:hypothetical protein
MDNKTPTAGLDAARQIPPRRHDAGSGQNETPDGSAAINEALRHPAEDTPSGASLADVELVPVFDRAHRAPKI